jgi:hypothetical protein
LNILIMVVSSKFLEKSNRPMTMVIKVHKVGVRYFLKKKIRIFWVSVIGLILPLKNELVESLLPSRTVHEGPPSCTQGYYKATW